MLSPLFVFGCGFALGWLVFDKDEAASPEPHCDGIEGLKNALLSYALNRVYGDRIDQANMDTYDGSKLPPFNGFSLGNACFSYFGQNACRTKAIQLFMNQNLSSVWQVTAFFDDFLRITGEDDDAVGSSPSSSSATLTSMMKDTGSDDVKDDEGGDSDEDGLEKIDAGCFLEQQCFSGSVLLTN